MDGYHRVGRIADYSDPSSTLIDLDDRPIVLLHAAGHFYALEDVCTHDGGPLSDGVLDAEAASIACPRHGARFDLATGAALSMPATKGTLAHEVTLAEGDIWVRLNEG